MKGGVKSGLGGGWEGRKGGWGPDPRGQTGLPGGLARWSEHPAKSHTLLAPHPSRLQLQLDFNLHNLPHLEWMGGGESEMVGRTGEGVLQRPEETRDRGWGEGGW